MLNDADIVEARIYAGQLAQEDLIQFAKLNQPDHADRLNPFRSAYLWGQHHCLVARHLEEVVCGTTRRLELELPPRHAKSELAIRQFAAWMAGRFPSRSGIVLTHTDELAQAHGRDVRDYMQGAGYKTTFGHKPESALRTDSRANDRLQTVAGGTITFSGSSGLGAGVGGDWLLVDDLFKNSEEAASETTRNAKWRAYNVDCKSRLNSQDCPIVMIGSRRNEDDVQGRIFDPTNPHYDAQEAARWVRIRLPALSEGEDVDPLKRPIDAPLWPERFDQAFFFEKRNSASDIIRDDFQTQYQCRPRPEEGTWFKKAWLKTYRTAELPKHLRIYVASDHAYRMKDKNDATCLLVVGMDATGAVYVLPDTFWRKCETDVMVDAMFTIARRHKVAMWWAARDAISGSLEPFIRRRMKDERCYFPLDDSIAESRDLVARSSSIRGMMARGEVYWPYEWPQWSQAEQQLLSFPAAHDDLCLAADSRIEMSDGSERPILSVKAGDMVSTPTGSQRVLESKCTGISEVSRYTFSDGRWLDATENHPIAIQSTSLEQKFVGIGALTMNHSVITLDSCVKAQQKQKCWNTVDTDTAATLNQNTGTIESIGTRQSHAEGFTTAICGKTITRFQSLLDLMCITAMRILSTTRLLILNCCQSESTLVCIYPSGLVRLTILQCSREYVQQPTKPRANLVQTPNGKRFCQIEQSSNGQTMFTSWFKFNVARVLKRFLPRFQNAQKPVAQPANSVTVVSKKVLGRLPTFNLTVENEHVFYANGILTHNCAALAMLGMGLERMVKAEGPKQKDLPVKGSYEWHCFGQENKDAKSGIWA